MTDTSTTIRERVAEAIEAAQKGHRPDRDDYLRMADAAIGIVVEVFLNGEASRIEEEKKCQTSETPPSTPTKP